MPVPGKKSSYARRQKNRNLFGEFRAIAPPLPEVVSAAIRDLKRRGQAIEGSVPARISEVIEENARRVRNERRKDRSNAEKMLRSAPNTEAREPARSAFDAAMRAKKTMGARAKQLLGRLEGAPAIPVLSRK